MTVQRTHTKKSLNSAFQSPPLKCAGARCRISALLPRPLLKNPLSRRRTPQRCPHTNIRCSRSRRASFSKTITRWPGTACAHTNCLSCIRPEGWCGFHGTSCSNTSNLISNLTYARCASLLMPRMHTILLTCRTCPRIRLRNQGTIRASHAARPVVARAHHHQFASAER